MAYYFEDLVHKVPGRTASGSSKGKIKRIAGMALARVPYGKRLQKAGLKRFFS